MGMFVGGSVGLLHTIMAKMPLDAMAIKRSQGREKEGGDGRERERMQCGHAGSRVERWSARYPVINLHRARGHLITSIPDLRCFCAFSFPLFFCCQSRRRWYRFRCHLRCWFPRPTTLSDNTQTRQPFACKTIKNKTKTKSHCDHHIQSIRITIHAVGPSQPPHSLVPRASFNCSSPISLSTIAGWVGGLMLSNNGSAFVYACG